MYPSCFKVQTSDNLQVKDALRSDGFSEASVRKQNAKTHSQIGRVNES